MSLYNDLTAVLTPYADKIKQNESDISDIQDALEHLDVATDTTLTQSGAPADAKVVGDEIAYLKSDLSETENEIIRTAGVVEELECGLTEEVKAALLACFAHVAWISDDGQTYYDALSNALNRSRVLSSIRAVFTQGSAVIYDTDELYSLKQYLTVTATYSDATTKEVNNYTLDGTLTAGTSTITVSYGKKTATFNVTVTHQQKTIESITATLSSSAAMTTDNVLDDLRPYLTVRATYSDGSTITITNYTLSGSLNIGANTITVTYSGKTATFAVNVTQAEKTLQSISAVFNQGSAVIYTDSSLDDLKPYLTVTARYSDNTTQTVTSYTLSGTLTAGTSTITASYGGKTATFNVVVSEAITVSPIYNWDFTKSLTDTISEKTATTNATRDSNGVTFSSPNQYIDFSLPFARNRTYEVDIDYIRNRVSQYTGHRRIFAFGTNGTSTESNTSAFLFSDHSPEGWWWYLGAAWDTQVVSTQQYSYFDNKTLKIYIDANGYGFVYAKPIGGNTYEYVGKSTGATTKNEGAYVFMGGLGNDGLANARIKAFRVYEGEK